MLTNSELNQIKNFLALYGKKDSQLSPVNTVDNTDYVAIVQNATNKNVRITIELLKKAVLEGLVNDDVFDLLIDAEPTENSRKLVRSNGIWHAINDNNVIDTNQIKNNAVTSTKIKNGEVKTNNIADKNVTEAKLSDDINNAMSKFTNNIRVIGGTSIEIGVNPLNVNFTIDNKVTFFGDRPDTDVTEHVENPSITKSVESDVVDETNNKWQLSPTTLGIHTLTYKSTYNGVTPTPFPTANVTLFLRKYFGYSNTTDDTVPSDVTTLPVEDAHTSVTCTFTIPALNNVDNTNKWRYIWFAIPSNMVIKVDATNDDANIIQASTGYKLKVHKFPNNQYYTTATRIIDDRTFIYKLYRSKLQVDSSVSTTLTITN